MPDRREVFESLYGAWRLAFLDQSGMKHFNLSFEGFWRSFFAAVLIAPAFAILVAQKLAARPGPLDLGWATLVQGFAYALSWAAFPLAAVVLTQLLGLSRNYVALIIALNWAAVLQVGVFLAAVLIEWIDEGVRSHGSGNVRSIFEGRSHGCHRLLPVHALRLAGFVLRHRAHVRHGPESTWYSRVVRHGGRFPVQITTRGDRFELTPPIPIEVLPGQILSRRKRPPRP